MIGAYQIFAERKINNYAVLVRKCNSNHIASIAGIKILAVGGGAEDRHTLLATVADQLTAGSSRAGIKADGVGRAAGAVHADARSSGTGQWQGGALHAAGRSNNSRHRQIASRCRCLSQATDTEGKYCCDDRYFFHIMLVVMLIYVPCFIGVYYRIDLRNFLS